MWWPGKIWVLGTLQNFRVPSVLVGDRNTKVYLKVRDVKMIKKVELGYLYVQYYGTRR
jgi:hypothetical protein